MPAARTTRQQRPSPAGNLKRTSRPTEVIEISSDDDDNAVPAYEALRSNVLEAQIKKLKSELAQAESDKQRIRKERSELQDTVKQLKALPPPPQTPQATADRECVPISKLEDDISCEICTLKMWQPYILHKCGHTFCLSCLKDWFSTTVSQHKAAHPQYNTNAPVAVPNYIRETIFYGQIIPRELASMLTALDTGGPILTCPTCRAPVKTRPVESFAIKNIVRSVAAAQGEQSPKKLASKARGKPRGPASKDPWAGLFPL